MNAVNQVQEASAVYSVEQHALLKSFDLLATAPDGVARLRELILSLAVQGKLVPQDPADEPASVLLARIHTEKQALIEAGKFKKDKPLAEIAHGDTPFELPSGWEWVRFGEVFTLEYGDALPADKRTNSGEFPVYGSNGIVGTHNVAFVKEPCIVVGRKGSAGAVNVCAKAGCCVTDVAYYCLPSSGFDLDFVAQLFRTLGLDALGKGIKPGLNRNEAYALLVAVPPAKEQSRIVARAEELMQLCDVLEQQGKLEAAQHARLVGTLFDALANSESALALAENWQRVAASFDLLLDRPAAVDALEQTLLQLAVRGLLVPQDPKDEPASELLKKIRAEKDHLIAIGKLKRDKPLPEISEEEKPFELPQGWGWVPFGEVVIISSGVTLGRKTPIKDPIALPYLRVANVQRWHLSLSDIKELMIDRSELDRFKILENDLLITEGGDWDKVGRTAIWRNEIPECAHQNHVFKARGVLPEWCPIWAELYLNSRDARTYFASSAKQTTNLASINMTELKGCPFPLPPLAEQSRIVARVAELRQLCADLRARLTAARSTQTRLAEALVEQAA